MNAYTPSTSLHSLAAPTELRVAIDQGVLDALAAGDADYIGAVDALIALCIQKGACFSSGEISAWLRTYRPDIRFNPQHDIGSRVRARFSEGLPDYASGRVVQVSRYTSGYSTTTLGHLVYVYAPSQQAGQAHPFEVMVPSAGSTVPALDALPSIPIQPPTLLQTPSATPTRRTSTRRRTARRQTRPPVLPSTASVHGNRRLCVPRSAFETLGQTLSTSIPGGTPVYVTREGDLLRISLTSAPDATPYTLVTARCRLLLSARGAATPLTPGSRYSVVVSGSDLTLDLSAPL